MAVDIEHGRTAHQYLWQSHVAQLQTVHNKEEKQRLRHCTKSWHIRSCQLQVHYFVFHLVFIVHVTEMEFGTTKPSRTHE